MKEQSDGLTVAEGGRPEWIMACLLGDCGHRPGGCWNSMRNEIAAHEKLKDAVRKWLENRQARKLPVDAWEADVAQAVLDADAAAHRLGDPIAPRLHVTLAPQMEDAAPQPGTSPFPRPGRRETALWFCPECEWPTVQVDADRPPDRIPDCPRCGTRVEPVERAGHLLELLGAVRGTGPLRIRRPPRWMPPLDPA